MKTVCISISSGLVHEGAPNVIGKASGRGEVVVAILSDESISSYKRAPQLGPEARKTAFSGVNGMPVTSLERNPKAPCGSPDSKRSDLGFLPPRNPVHAVGVPNGFPEAIAGKRPDTAERRGPVRRKGAR